MMNTTARQASYGCWTKMFRNGLRDPWRRIPRLFSQLRTYEDIRWRRPETMAGILLQGWEWVI